MRALSIVTLLFATCLCGCTSRRLQHSIASQATTVTDLQYTQVLNNLARVSVMPDVLPSLVQIKEGSAQIQDFGQLALAGEFGRTEGFHLGTGLPAFTGSRTVVEQWGISPVVDDVELKILRIAYQRAIGLPSHMDFELADGLARELGKQIAETSDIDRRNEIVAVTRFREKFADSYAKRVIDELNCKTKTPKDDQLLDAFRDNANFNTALDSQAELNTVSTNSAHIILEREFDSDPSLDSLNPQILVEDKITFFTPLAQTVRREVKDVQRDLEEISPGWFATGTKHDVPKNACFVGQYKDRYAWVCPNGVAGLSRFTLTTMGFSDIIKDRTVLTIPGGPRFTPSAGR